MVFEAIIGGFKGEVYLYIDCCFSGNWCYTAKKLFDQSVYPFREFKNIHIYTSADRFHSIEWGKWRERKFKTTIKDEYGKT